MTRPINQITSATEQQTNTTSEISVSMPNYLHTRAPRARRTRQRLPQLNQLAQDQQSLVGQFRL
ncbi:MAG TPA: hypothetical protein VGJ93_11860 [Desulfuromonadaceae bacterium]